MARPGRRARRLRRRGHAGRRGACRRGGGRRRTELGPVGHRAVGESARLRLGQPDAAAAGVDGDRERRTRRRWGSPAVGDARPGARTPSGLVAELLDSRGAPVGPSPATCRRGDQQPRARGRPAVGGSSDPMAPAGAGAPARRPPGVGALGRSARTRVSDGGYMSSRAASSAAHSRRAPRPGRTPRPRRRAAARPTAPARAPASDQRQASACSRSAAVSSALPVISGPAAASRAGPGGRRSRPSAAGRRSR